MKANMKKEVINKFKVVAGVLALVMLFTGAFVGINNAAFANSTGFGINSVAFDNGTGVEDFEEGLVTVLGPNEICPELWTEEDDRLQEVIRNNFLAMELEPPLSEEELNEAIAWEMLTTPRERHLSRLEALWLGVEWMYEEFGIIVDFGRYGYDYGYSPYVWLNFEHESVGINNRSFWTGGYGHILFSLDGITGERVAILDESQPFEFSWTEISLEDMNFKVTDTTGMFMHIGPSFATLQMPYHFTTEEVAILVAEYVYEAFGKKIDGLYVELVLSNWDMYGNLTNQVQWFVVVGDYHCNSWADVEGFLPDAVENVQFYLVIDAVTGSLIFIEGW